MRAKKVIEESNGVVEEVTDQQILDAKAVVDAAGIGCEPGSATRLFRIELSKYRQRRMQ